jgi:hypothetical protein
MLGGMRFLPFAVAVHPAYAVIAWLCWVPNVAAAELWLNTARA